MDLLLIVCCFVVSGWGDYKMIRYFIVKIMNFFLYSI